MSDRRALILSLSRTPVECELFAEGCERSVEGSLRLLPGFPVEVTEGELEALKSQGLAYRVLIPLPELPKEEEAKAKPEPVKEEKVKKKSPAKKASKSSASGGKKSE